MTREEIIRMAREAGYGDAMSELHAPALERFACLVAAAEGKALANEFSKAVTETLESLAATTLMPSPPMPMAIKNLDAIAAAVAAERESVCAKGG